MAQITITIPNPQLPRVLDAFARQFAYSATIPDPAHPGATLPNPETQAQFVQRQVRLWIQGVVRSQEAATAAQSAIVTAQANVDSTLGLT